MEDQTPETKSHRPGVFPLFTLFGIRVSIHWTWLIIAVVMIQTRMGDYRSPIWNVAEYLSLFAIVLMHEFGHALACRSVGGEANRIMLWPLGGVAFVSPPPRAGAYLWSIIAGPLVNAILVPVTYGAVAIYEIHGAGFAGGMPRTDFGVYLSMMAIINLVLLVFNMLPIYPLDGGQVLRGVLWLFVGPIRSLSIAARVGLLGAIAFGAIALRTGNPWLFALALFAAFQCMIGLRQAQWLRERLAALPRGIPVGRGSRNAVPSSPASVTDVYTPAPGPPVPVASPAAGHRSVARCPKCHRPAPAGPLWQCDCGGQFDLFAENARCPECQSLQTVTGCPYCGEFTQTTEWSRPPE